jgi:hypothetical protein
LDHEPSASAAAIASNPGAAILPSRTSRSIRSLVTVDHPLLALRRVMSTVYRSSSRRPAVLSIQPKQSASSTASA